MSTILEPLDLVAVIQANPDYQMWPNSYKLRVAQQALYLCITLAGQVTDDLDDRYSQANIVDRLKQLAGRDHGFAAYDYNLGDWITRVKAGEDGV